MITMKDFMETVNYKITEGADFQWNCYGPNAYSIDSWNGKHGDNGYTVSIVFDTKTQEVYEMTAYDYADSHERAYRWTHPEYIDARRAEADQRNVDNTVAWDDIKFTELEVEHDILDKASAIVRGESYDERIVVPIELPKDTMFEMMKMAHEQDITLNEMIESILADVAYREDMKDEIGC